MIEKRVDFPAPFLPTTPMRSRRLICKLAFANKVRPAYAFEILLMDSIRLGSKSRRGPKVKNGARGVI
jgi:hypothetical protein